MFNFENIAPLTIKNGYLGKSITTDIPVTEGSQKDRFVVISTSKRSNGDLCCTAQLTTIDNTGAMESRSFMMFSDWSVVLHNEKVRCTDKSLIDIQTKGIEKLKELFTKGYFVNNEFPKK